MAREDSISGGRMAAARSREKMPSRVDMLTKTSGDVTFYSRKKRFSITHE